MPAILFRLKSSIIRFIHFMQSGIDRDCIFMVVYRISIHGEYAAGNNMHYYIDNWQCISTSFWILLTVYVLGEFGGFCLVSFCCCFSGLVFRRNLNKYRYLYNYSPPQVAEFFPHGRQGSAHFTISTLWLLLAWRRKESIHQRWRVWSSLPGKYDPCTVRIDITKYWMYMWMLDICCQLTEIQYIISRY